LGLPCEGRKDMQALYTTPVLCTARAAQNRGFSTLSGELGSPSADGPNMPSRS